MTTKQAMEIVAILKAAFPRQQVEPETVKVYATFLQDLDGAVAEPAVKRLVTVSRFFPTIAEMREAVAEASVNAPTVQQAVEAVMTRSAIPVEERPKLHPLVRRALDAIGGLYAIRTAESATTIRAQFRDAYAALRSEAILEIQTGRAALAQSPIERLAAATAPALPAPELRAMP